MRKKILVTLVMAVGMVLFQGCGHRGEDAVSLMEQGVRCFQAGDYAGAAAAYQRAIDLEPGNPVAYNLLGMARRFQYNATGDPSMRARETAAFRRAVDLDPNFLAAVKNLAATLHRDGDLAGAAGLARRALEINPDDPEKEILKTWIRDIRSKVK